MNRMLWCFRLAKVLFSLRVIIALIFPADLVSAQVLSTRIVVTTVADELNSDGDCSLREAIRAANLNMAVDACEEGSVEDVIVIGQGEFLISIAGSGDNEGLTGDLDIYSNVTINGAGLDKTIINGMDLDRVFHITGPYTVKFTNLTIQNGFSTSGTLYGGGILELFNCKLSDNQANCTGGGSIMWGRPSSRI